MKTFAESTGLTGFSIWVGNIVMIGIAFFLPSGYPASSSLLLLTIAFGMLLTNLPERTIYHTELFCRRACPLGHLRRPGGTCWITFIWA